MNETVGSDSAVEQIEQRAVQAGRFGKRAISDLWAARVFLMVWNGGVTFTGVFLLLFVVPPYYESSVVVLPDFARAGGGVLSQLSGLASLSGLGNFNLGSGVPPEIHQNLLYSESVLFPAFDQKYETNKFDEPVSLLEYFEVEPNESLPPEAQRRQQHLDFLEVFAAQMFRVSIDRISGILTVTVRMPESGLSAAVVNRVTSNLDRYVVDKNREAAGQTMTYIQGRLADVQDSLAFAEEQLRAFREQNRVRQAPELQLEEDRLQRRVDLKQVVYMELERQFEIARIEQQKETPIVNFREPARGPIEKTGPKRTFIMLVVMFVTGTVTTLWVMIRANVRRVVAAVRAE